MQSNSRNTGKQKGAARKRGYDNSGREKQVEERRRRIVQSLIKQLLDNDRPDFTIEQAAADAGVTTRTIFRHFPNRESMLAAVSEQVLEITGKVALPASLSDFRRAIYDSYTMFEEHPELMRALLLSDLGRGVRSPLTQRRRQSYHKVLDQAVGHLAEDEQKVIRAVLVHLITAETWWQLRSEFDVHGTEVAATLDWIISLALKALADGDHPSVHEGPNRKNYVSGDSTP